MEGGQQVATDEQERCLVLVVGYEGSDPARRALAAAGRILGDRGGWIEVVYVRPIAGAEQSFSEPAADVIDSLGPSQADLHYEVRSMLDAQNQTWRLRSKSGAVAEELLEAAEAIADEEPSRAVAIVVGSDRQLAFSVPTTLARRSSFPVVIVP